ncbi:hypothetical protein BVY03_01060, partial [bacterium K02(2017)]
MILGKLNSVRDGLFRWPVLSWLVLQISLSFCLDSNSFVLLFLLGSINLLLFYIHLKSKFYWSYFVGFVICCCSLWIFKSSQKPLSEVFTKSADYMAKVNLVKSKNNNFTKVVINLKYRLKPLKKKVTGRVLLTVGDACDLREKDLVRFKGVVKQAIPYKNPGVFDYRLFLKRQNIGAVAFVKECEQLQVLDRPEPTLGNNLKQKMRDHLAEYSKYPLVSS